MISPTPLLLFTLLFSVSTSFLIPTSSSCSSFLTGTEGAQPKTALSANPFSDFFKVRNELPVPAAGTGEEWAWPGAPSRKR